MNAYTMFRCFLGAGLLLIGCADDPTAGTRTDDAGSGGALAGDAGAGGTGGTATGGTGGSATADGGGTGGVVMPGTGGAGSGGAAGSGGVTGTGGVSGSGGNVGTGGTVADTACVDPMGWKIQGGLGCNKAKGGRECATNCISIRPNGQSGNYIGPPMHAECWFGDFVCVASCSECQ